MRGESRKEAPFASGKHLTERAVNYMLKRVAAKDRGAALPVVQVTLGHGNISVTSGYLHARPDSSSGLSLDPGVFL